jgi:uncharacterized membrane protein (UPF0127 family)
MKRGALFRGSECLVGEAWKTTNAWDRMRGLLGRPELQGRQGLLIEPCAAVHTIGMRYSLDLVFLDRQLRVKKTVRKLRPWRWAACPGAHFTLELAPGALDAAALNVGDALEWRP